MSPVKTSPKRERFNVESNRKSNPNTDRTPERVPYFDIKSA